MVSSYLGFGALAALVVLAACGGKVVVDAPEGAGGSTGSTSTGTTSTGTTSGGGGGEVICNPKTVMCNSPVPDCTPGEVASVVNGCWGACVPILSCATEPSCNDCAGFCAAYVGEGGAEYRCAMPMFPCSSLSCACVAPYFCAAPFNACVQAPPGGPIVNCECPNC